MLFEFWLCYPVENVIRSMCFKMRLFCFMLDVVRYFGCSVVHVGSCKNVKKLLWILR